MIENTPLLPSLTPHPQTKIKVSKYLAEKSIDMPQYQMKLPSKLLFHFLCFFCWKNKKQVLMRHWVGKMVIDCTFFHGKLLSFSQTAKSNKISPKTEFQLVEMEKWNLFSF